MNDGAQSFDTRTELDPAALPAAAAIHDGPPAGDSVRIAEGEPPGLHAGVDAPKPEASP